MKHHKVKAHNSNDMYMNKDQQIADFLLKEYQAAQDLTFHIDNLRSKLTQFFLVFLGISITGLSLLLKGESSTSFFSSIESPVAIISLIISIIGSISTLLIARLRSAQFEHFRIVNKIRGYFLKTDVQLRNIVELSKFTLPVREKWTSGSYYWALLIILSTSSMYFLTAFLFMKGSGFSEQVSVKVGLFCFLLSMVVFNFFYMRMSKPIPEIKYKSIKGGQDFEPII